MKQKTRLDGVHAGVLAAAAAAFLLRTLRLDDWHTGGLAHPSVFAVFVHDRDGDVAGAENLRVGREHRQTVRRGPRPPPIPPSMGQRGTNRTLTDLPMLMPSPTRPMPDSFIRIAFCRSQYLIQVSSVNP